MQRKRGEDGNEEADEGAVQSVCLSALPVPQLAGALSKEGFKHKNWKTRWFVLIDGRIYYFARNKPAERALGVIELEGRTIQSLPASMKKKFGFALVQTGARAFHLCGKSQKEKDEWIIAIIAARKDAAEKKEAGEKVARESEAAERQLRASKEEELAMDFDFISGKNPLPDSVVLQILVKLPLPTLGQLLLVNSHWKRAALRQDVWRLLAEEEFGPTIRQLEEDSGEDLPSGNTHCIFGGPPLLTHGTNWQLNLLELRRSGRRMDKLAGAYYSVAVLDRSLYMWGRAVQPVMEPMMNDSDTPVRIAVAPKGYDSSGDPIDPGKSVSMVSAGQTHFMCATEDGHVYTWGYGMQLGLEGYTHRLVERPRRLDSLEGEKIVFVAAGGQHSAAINAKGVLFMWGDGKSGVLGVGDQKDHICPVTVDVLRRRGLQICCVSLGNAHTLAISACGKTFAWGAPDNGRLGIKGLSAKGQLTDPRGSSGNDEQLQYETTYAIDMARAEAMSLSQQRLSASYTAGVCRPVELRALRDHKVRAISAGGSHSLAVTDTGIAFAWGRGFEGQLGLKVSGEPGDAGYPQDIEALRAVRVVCVAAGAYHSLAVTDDGQLYGWGMSDFGQLGLGFSSRMVVGVTRISSLEGVRIVSASAGPRHSLAVDERGIMYSWGMGSSGQLGHPDVPKTLGVATMPVPKVILGLVPLRNSQASGFVRGVVHAAWEPPANGAGSPAATGRRSSAASSGGGTAAEGSDGSGGKAGSVVGEGGAPAGGGVGSGRGTSEGSEERGAGAEGLEHGGWKREHAGTSSGLANEVVAEELSEEAELALIEEEIRQIETEIGRIRGDEERMRLEREKRRRSERQRELEMDRFKRLSSGSSKAAK